MDNRKNIAVIGGGASGMIAAITAARNGAKVKVFERMDRVGKKLLATGNGRCNFTNSNINIGRYHGRNVEFFNGAYNYFDLNKTIDFFEKLGINCRVEEGGKIYPYSGQASSVLDVLRYEMNKQNVEEICGSEVVSIIKKGESFNIFLKDGKSFKADRVIIAAGGKASPNLGSNGSGYRLCESFGHKLIKPIPSLVQLRLSSPFLKSLKGVKFDGEVKVYCNEKMLRKEFGEVLFTEYGISGPPILQLSRSAVESLENGGNPYISVDMFPQFEYEELFNIIKNKFYISPEKPLDFSFVGFINKRLINSILKQAEIDNIHKECGSLSNKEINSILKVLKEWTFKVTGYKSWSEAQVTAGGIDTKDINKNTMESLLIKGLYFAGEIMDIDGDCGGFNLQWAWSSGYTAGYFASISTDS